MSDRLRLGMAKMQAAIGETSAAASGRMISLEEVIKKTLQPIYIFLISEYRGMEYLEVLFT